METKIKISDELVMNQIYIIRDHKVMLDSDLAELYGVETKQLKLIAYINILVVWLQVVNDKQIIKLDREYEVTGIFRSKLTMLVEICPYQFKPFL